MSWYRTGTVTVTNGSKTVTGVGTLWTSAVNAGDAFAIVDANLNPTGAWYEVESVTNNTTLVLKQSYAGTTGSNKQYCVFNLVGNMTTPSFAQRLATFFASFQSLIDKPTTTPTASSIPIADANGDIDSGWIKDATASVKGVVELATSAETLTGTDTARAVTPKALADTAFYRKGNILGTVSQSGGVPTGAVIERGSNSNGEYVKFADGTLICTFSALLSTGEYTWTYPVEFAIYPQVTCCPKVSTSSYLFSLTSHSSLQTSSAKFYGNVSTNSGTSWSPSSAAIRMTAIGRWF